MGGRYGGGPRPVKSRSRERTIRSGLADEALIDIAGTYNVSHSTNSSCVNRAPTAAGEQANAAPVTDGG